MSVPAQGSSIGLVGLGTLVVGQPDAIVPCWMIPVERTTRLGRPGLGVVGFVGPYVGLVRCWPACGEVRWNRRRKGLGHPCGCARRRMESVGCSVEGLVQRTGLGWP